jgi:hypothetical protein
MPNDVEGGYNLFVFAEKILAPTTISLTLTSLKFSEGGAGFTPTSPERGGVTIYPNEFEVVAPAGAMSGGARINTKESIIAGTIFVDPPTEVIVTCTGQDEKFILADGMERGTFKFHVSPSTSLPPDEAARRGSWMPPKGQP